MSGNRPPESLADLPDGCVHLTDDVPDEAEYVAVAYGWGNPDDHNPTVEAGLIDEGLSESGAEECREAFRNRVPYIPDEDPVTCVVLPGPAWEGDR